MISKGSLVRYLIYNGTGSNGLRRNGIYLVVSDTYMTERRRRNRMGPACKLLVDGVGIHVDAKNLEIVE